MRRFKFAIEFIASAVVLTLLSPMLFLYVAWMVGEELIEKLRHKYAEVPKDRCRVGFDCRLLFGTEYSDCVNKEACEKARRL